MVRIQIDISVLLCSLSLSNMHTMHMCTCVCVHIFWAMMYFLLWVGFQKIEETLITLNSCYKVQGTTLELIMEKIQIKLLPLFKTQWERKTSMKINKAGCDKFHNKVLFEERTHIFQVLFFRLLVFHLLNKYEVIIFKKWYISYFCLCYLYLLRLGLGSCESRVSSFNENNEHRVGGKTYTTDYMCLLLTDVILHCIFYISQFGNKLLIFNKTYFFERQIPHSVSHPLRSQDSMSKSIQLNTERSKSHWRWVYLRFLFFLSLLLPPFSLLHSLFLPLFFLSQAKLHLGNFYAK